SVRDAAGNIRPDKPDENAENGSAEEPDAGQGVREQEEAHEPQSGDPSPEAPGPASQPPRRVGQIALWACGHTPVLSPFSFGTIPDGNASLTRRAAEATIPCAVAAVLGAPRSGTEREEMSGQILLTSPW